MTEANVPTGDGCSGCAKGCVLIIGGLIAVFGVIFTVGLLFPDILGGRPEPTPRPEMVRVTGTILLSPQHCSHQQTVVIRPSRGMPEVLQMDGDAYRPGQPCNLRIDTRVERASSYEIDVRGVSKETFPDSMVTGASTGMPTLEIRLAW